jgi:predicted restriction endonuclease
MACLANIIPAVLGANGVVLDLGRSQPVATPHQRRALRVLYQTCAISGCGVAFEHCTPHHISYWRNGGRTDIGNLLPLCSRHHHLAHEGGWQFSLDHESRALTVIKPDGSRQTHPPPLARAG